MGFGSAQAADLSQAILIEALENLVFFRSNIHYGHKITMCAFFQAFYFCLKKNENKH